MYNYKSTDEHKQSFILSYNSSNYFLRIAYIPALFGARLKEDESLFKICELVRTSLFIPFFDGVRPIFKAWTLLRKNNLLNTIHNQNIFDKISVSNNLSQEDLLLVLQKFDDMGYLMTEEGQGLYQNMIDNPKFISLFKELFEDGVSETVISHLLKEVLHHSKEKKLFYWVGKLHAMKLLSEEYLGKNIALILKNQDNSWLNHALNIFTERTFNKHERQNYFELVISSKNLIIDADLFIVLVKSGLFSGEQAIKNYSAAAIESSKPSRKYERPFYMKLCCLRNEKSLTQEKFNALFDERELAQISFEANQYFQRHQLPRKISSDENNTSQQENLDIKTEASNQWLDLIFNTLVMQEVQLAAIALGTVILVACSGASMVMLGGVLVTTGAAGLTMRFFSDKSKAESNEVQNEVQVDIHVNMSTDWS